MLSSIKPYFIIPGPYNVMQEVTIINGVAVNRLQLANALLQPNPTKMALRLMSVLFTVKELTNGNLTGRTNSKDRDRIATIKSLNPKMIAYIRGIYINYTSIDLTTTKCM